MYNEHGNLGAIFALIKDLRRLKGTGIKTFDLYLPEDWGVKGRSCEVTVIDDSRCQEGCELVENLLQNHE